MTEHFVTYEIALALKELEFNEECLAKYRDVNHIFSLNSNNYCSTDFKFNHLSTISKFTTYVTAPLWEQVIDWFDKKYNYKIKYNSYKPTMERDILLAIEYQKEIKK